MESLLKGLDYAGTAFLVVFFFGFCVFIHEMGHLLVALWRGLHVESFSVGFGKELWGKTYKGVRYKLSMLPFGGYVSLPQLETAEEWKDKDGNPLPAVKPIDRILTAFAGPFFNILFGLLLGTFIWAVGVQKPIPTPSVKVASVTKDSPEAKAGLKIGDIITKVNGEKFTKGFQDVFERVLLSETKDVTLTITRSGQEQTIVYTPAVSDNPKFEGLAAPQFLSENDVIFTKIIKDSPAEKAGFKVGDQPVSVNGVKVLGEAHFTDLVSKSQGKTLTIKFIRDGKEMTFSNIIPSKKFLYRSGMTLDFNANDPIKVTAVEPGSPAANAGIKVGQIITSINDKVDLSAGDVLSAIRFSEGKSFSFTVQNSDASSKKTGDLKPEKDVDSEYYQMGVALSAKLKMQREHVNPFAQFSNVISKTWRTIKALTSPESKIKAKHMSGPLGIVKAMGQTFNHGFMYGLELVVFISFSLAIMNLLPLPVLDGGHITFATLEMFLRRKLPLKFMQIIEVSFVVLLLSFMAYVTWFDIGRVTGLGKTETTRSIKI